MTTVEWVAVDTWGFVVIVCLMTVVTILAQIRDRGHRS